jgi:hypothetical protein
VDRETRGAVLAGVAALATLAAVAPQWSVGALDTVLPGRAARVAAPLAAALVGGWAAVTAADERRESTAMSDRYRTAAVVLGAVAVVTGLPLALLGLLA